MTFGGMNLEQLAAAYKAPEAVMSAIQSASQKTGVDFSFLLNKAKTESSFNPAAKAPTSSATGLYQFVDKTWLQMVRDHGSECGLDQYASQINGQCQVTDPAARAQILSLRKDPTLSAYMAAEYTKDNEQQLKQNISGKVGKTELYLAHFLGAGGATQFLQAYEKTPNASAASVLPDAAAANPSVFYAKDGSALSLSQVYNQFASKFNDNTPVNNNTAAAVPSATQQTLPASPALAAQMLPGSSSSIAAIGNIHIAAMNALCNGTNSPEANENNPLTILSGSALAGVQQQSNQQQLAYLTQVALETLNKTSPTAAFGSTSAASTGI